VPASLKWQWAQQIAKLTDVETTTKRVKVDGETLDLTVPVPARCVVVEGSKAQRDKQYAFVLQSRPEYVILGYENVVNDWRTVRRIKPEMIVLDECTAIKTFKAERTKKIKRWTAPYRLALTGTPMENGKPEELFSQMQWVDDTVLGRFDLFDKTYIVRNKYGAVVRYKNLPVLHAKLADVMVRKTRADPEVAKYLPKTQEDNIVVRLDPATRQVYRNIAADLLFELRKAGESARGSFDLFAHYHGGESGMNENTQQGRIMSRMQALDMLLNHPGLIVASAQDYEASAKERARGVEKASWPGSKYCWQVHQSGGLDPVLDAIGGRPTPKLDALVADIQRAVAASEKNKIIVFSYYRRMGDFIAEALEDVGTVQYHGEMNAGAKAAAVAKFRDDPKTRVIICSHAGAFGTDLYMANYLYNYDLAWSSGAQDQINARHSRAASEFEHIYVLNMITKDTTEERKPQVLEFKRRTASAIMDNRGADSLGRVENDIATLSTYLEQTLDK